MHGEKWQEEGKKSMTFGVNPVDQGISSRKLDQVQNVDAQECLDKKLS